MVLTATQALALTNNTISIHAAQTLQEEVGCAEAQIRTAAGRELFQIRYSAKAIGNPFADPHVDTNLTSDQIAFRDAFVNAGYFVDLDEETGLWLISWELVGPATVVTVYSVRTIVVPGAIITQTVDRLNDYFEQLVPVVRSRSEFVNIGPGGDIDESDFGATNSVFYEYVVVTEQPDSTDHSAALKTWLVAAGLGYQTTPTNVEIYRTIIT